MRIPEPTEGVSASALNTLPSPARVPAPETSEDDRGEDSCIGSGRLTGRVALVTGGDHGLGRAVALAFAREGTDVAITHFDAHAAARRTVERVRAAGRRGLALSGDLGNPDHCRAVVARVATQLGALDILVNVATHQRPRDSLLGISPRELEQTFRTNLFATVWLTQAALEHMHAGSVIINTGSATAEEGDPLLIDYAASQAAVHALTRSLARSLARRGVRVSCVALGASSNGTERTAGRSPADGPRPADLAATYVMLAADTEGRWNGSVLRPSLPPS